MVYYCIDLFTYFDAFQASGAFINLNSISK